MERLKGFDAAFLAMESATNHMHVASLLILDPSTAPTPVGWSFERVRELVQARLPCLPAFRRRLVRVPFGINHPLWAEDAVVDLSFHLRRVGLPRPGGDRELADAVADLMGRPLDRTRPLWELHVIEGLEDDLVAVVVKAHHCVLDGISGAEVLVSLLDDEADPGSLEGPGPGTAAAGASDNAGEAEPIPTEAELIGEAVAALPGTDDVVRAVQRAMATVSSVRRRNAGSHAEPPPSPFTAPPTSLNVRIGPWRRVAWARLALEDVRTVTAALGGTANDVVLALCSGALRSYFVDRGEQPDGELVALVPLSVRTGQERASLGNKVSPMLVSLATKVDEPAERLRAISRGAVQARAQDRAVERDLLSDWAELVVPALAVPAARLASRLLTGGALAPPFNLIVSNVPGRRTRLFLAGAAVMALYPLGPVVDSVALNVTVISYLGDLHVGLVADRDAVPLVTDLARSIEHALDELKKEAEASGRR